MRDGMRIGELAARFGLNPKTIRYYEEIGLLKRADRTESGYRLYTRQDVERLGFIRRAKMLGLSLDEIRDILSVQQKGSPPCSQVLDALPNWRRSALNSRPCGQPGLTRTRASGMLQPRLASVPSSSSRPR